MSPSRNIRIWILLLRLLYITLIANPSNAGETKNNGDVSYTAQWSSSFLSIQISIESFHKIRKVFDTDQLYNDCCTILDDDTLALIGTESTCIWSTISKQSYTLSLTIHLAPTATIGLHDSLTVLATNIESISMPPTANEPNILISSSTTLIGACDDLILDARSTTNLGGRDAVFTWIVTNINDETDTITYEDSGNYIEINQALLLAGATYDISLTVTNWYGQSSTTQYTVELVDIAVPVITLHGLHSNDNLEINSVITLHDECTQDTTDTYQIQNIKWDVEMTVMPEYEGYVTADMTKLAALKNRLNDFDDTESIRIAVSSFLQSGFVYDFTMFIICDALECSTYGAYEERYGFTEIQCGILGGDIVLNDVNPNTMSDIRLNGLLLTYDDHDDGVLQWNWDCVTASGDSCVDLIDSVSDPVISIGLSAVSADYASTNTYLITMEVSDAANTFRDRCLSDTISLTINTADVDSVTDSNTLRVSATAIRHEINSNEPLRVIGTVSDTQDEFIYTYEWQEVNGLLTQQYAQMNLIVDSDVLQEGTTYALRLKVTATSSNGDIIASDESNTVSVYVKKAPVVVSGSFTITPQCTNEYETIAELLATSHVVSVSADGDNSPLLYEFGLEMHATYHYVHDTLLSQSSMDDVYLPPIGSFALFAHVYDSESSVVYEEMECSIALKSYSECLDFESLLQLDGFISKSNQNRYIVQQSYVYLEYLGRQYTGNDDDCIETQVLTILSTIHDQFTTDIANICDEQNVVQLAQTMTSLLALVNALSLGLDADALDKIDDVLFVLLDPCSYISDTIGNALNDLSISDASVITGQPTIHYQDNDISSRLSPIISQITYQPLLFDLISQILSLSASLDVYDLLSSSIYIAQMIDISVSISGESNFAQFDSFSIYSERVIPGQSVDVSIQNINVHIPNDNTIVSTDDDSIFAATDILISAVKVTESYAADGILIGNVLLDVTLLSDTVDSSNLPSNIEFTFPFDDANTDDGFACVWYDKTNDIWSNDGCDTTVDDMSSTIVCSCEHLTTFAVIYNMHETETNVFVDETSSELERYAHWLLSAIFLMICFYVLFQIYPFFTHKELDWKHRAVFVMLLVAITSFLYFLICLEYLFLSSSSTTSIKVMSLLLLLPHISYLLIFSVLFYTWFTLAHSFNPDCQDMRATLRRFLIGLNSGVSLLLLIYFILIVCDVDHIFRIASFVWSGLTAIITIVITIYAIISGKILYQTTKKAVSKQSFAAEDWKVVRRLITINACITLYFIFETCITIYYAIYMDNTSNIMSHKLLELVVNVFCLVCICWMYRESMKRLIESNLYLAERHKKDMQERKKTQNNSNARRTCTTTQITCTSTAPRQSTLSIQNHTLEVPSLTQSKSPPPPSRFGFSLPVIAENKVIKAHHTVQDTPLDRGVTIDETDNSVIIAADPYITPEVSMRSQQRESSLIQSSESDVHHQKKEKEQKAFQFYYDLRDKLSTVIADGQLNEDDAKDETEKDMDETETEMYAYVCSNRRRSIKY